jgi:O-antigen ligase
MGLFFSFSRSAWLGTLAGLAYLMILIRPWRRLRRLPRTVRRRILLGTFLLVASIAALGVAFAPLLQARLLHLNTPLERRSIEDRYTDVKQAWKLIRSAPLHGVGTGYYRGALQERAGDTPPPEFRTVHNIPLLAAAEMGVLGALLWLALILSLPIAHFLRSSEEMGTGADSDEGAEIPLDRGHPASPQPQPPPILPIAASSLRTSWAATFVSAMAISMLDVYLYFPMTWWPALYLGIVAGSWGRGEERAWKEVTR